jgi:acyl-CoA dehydrogenase
MLDTSDHTSKAFGAWELPEELQQLRDTTRRFMENDVKPVEDTLPHDSIYCPAEKLDPLKAKAKSLGLWLMRTPAEYGGAGLNLLAQTIWAEEASKCRMGAYILGMGAFGIDPPNVIWEGNRDQIERYGIPAAKLGRKVFTAISEPSGGADPARAIKTRAVLKGDRYILNGQKMWITAAKGCDWGIVYARTGEGGRGGITSFIVDGDAKGITYKEIPVIRAYPAYEIFFDNVEVPVENRLGEEGQGFKLAEKWLVEGRVPYASGTLGVAQAAINLATEWAKQREAFGSRLSDKQAIQWMIADSEMELRAARLLCYEAAWKCDLGQPFKIEASIAKVVSTETAGRVVDRAIQIFGGLGVSKQMPLERWYREMRIKRIGEGPSEVQRMVVARHLLGNRG